MCETDESKASQVVESILDELDSLDFQLRQLDIRQRMLAYTRFD